MSQEKKVRVPWTQRKEYLVRVTTPLAIWICAALIVAVQLYKKTDRFEYVGLARTAEYFVSAQFEGRIRSMSLGLYEEVEAGQIVSRMDDDQVLARIATSTARIEKLTSDLDAVYTEFLSNGGAGTADWVADLRRFQVDEENRRLAVMGLKVEIESDRVELERRNLELERFRRLMETRLISQLEFDTVRLQTEQVEKRIDENEQLLKQAETEYARAEQRRKAYERNAPMAADENPLLESLRRAVSVESRVLEEIQVERQALALRSPISGRVSRIDCRQGQSVQQGQTILAISESEVKEIVAYIPDTDLVRLKPQMAVNLSSRLNPGKIVGSVVLRIGPGVEQLPQRLWRDPMIPDYGYGVVIAVDSAMNLIPGEIVDVRFQ